ncbi:MAG: hypothetical protein HY862_21365 [Chloroflexi bacterium]|nr:hypothetical protein [Chloroflexota bacterium]
MSEVILVVCDALRNDIAAEEMGYLESLVEGKRQGNTGRTVSQSHQRCVIY